MLVTAKRKIILYYYLSTETIDSKKISYFPKLFSIFESLLQIDSIKLSTRYIYL